MLLLASVYREQDLVYLGGNKLPNGDMWTMIGMCGVVCASTHINQVNDAGVAGGPVQRHRNLECTQSARVGTADQAWPPYTVDLHATAPRRKDQRQCLLRHTRPQHQHEDTPLVSTVHHLSHPPISFL